MRALVVLIIGLALTECTLYDPPEKPTKLASEISPQEWCGEARMLLENPYLDADTKQAVLEEMRSRRCSAPIKATAGMMLPTGSSSSRL